MYDILIKLIGEPPPGYEPLLYVMTSIFVLILFDFLNEMIRTITRFTR